MIMMLENGLRRARVEKLCHSQHRPFSKVEHLKAHLHNLSHVPFRLNEQVLKRQDIFSSSKNSMH